LAEKATVVKLRDGGTRVMRLGSTTKQLRSIEVLGTGTLQ
jgi:hypothetical protein